MVHTSAERLSAWLNRWPLVMLMLPALFWAGNAVLGRGVVGVIPPVSLAFWRWTIALLLVLPFTWRRTQAELPQVNGRWGWLILLSFLGITIFNTLQYLALTTTTALNTALLQTPMPAIIILITWLFFRENISRLQGVGVAVCILGALFIVSRGDWEKVQQLSFVVGDLWMLLAVLLYAGYSTLLRYRPPIHPASFLTLTFAFGILMLLPFYLWELWVVGGFALTLGTLGSLAYVGIFPSILAYLCWNQGVALVGANRAGLFINLIPVFASILAFFFLGERVAWFHLVGMGLIFTGILLFNVRGRSWKG